jgi:hypothetical protein
VLTTHRLEQIVDAADSLGALGDAMQRLAKLPINFDKNRALGDFYS